MPREIICRYCNKPFTQSPYHPSQEVCTSEACQRRRKREYHRKKLADDPTYRQTCADSRKNWRDNNPDYQRQYRRNNAATVERNRQKQQERNRKRRLSMIVKNNLAIDVTRSFTKVLMVGPSIGEIVKNNLAISQVMVLQVDTPRQPRPVA
jgi:hypothetical protein